MRIPKLPVLALKGGVGKTTTCISLAKSLQARGFNVGILDVDIHASALPRALGIVKPPGYETVRGDYLQPIEHEGLKIFSIGLLFGETTPNMWTDTQKAQGVKQIATTSIDWGDLDWIVVDTPPTSGIEVQVLLQNLQDIHGAVIVCQPNDLAVLALNKTMEMLREMNTPVSGIVANMFGYTCPHCNQESNPFDRSAEDVIAIADQFKVPYLGSIPFGKADRRQLAADTILDNILSKRPVRLKTDKGGVKRWAISQIVKWID